MVILTGENLGKRQQDLNKQVHDVATRKDDFEKVKQEPNSTDPDVLFKIDLASKYKNVDYILDILKSGDSLHISRALKCTWLYDDECSNVINVDYLHQNIFPSMSFKMKRKFLTTISMYLKNEDRAGSFYTYCTGVKLHNIALKFLIFTSESFKIEVINTSIGSIVEAEELFYKNFVGSSFTLATAIIERAPEYPRSKILYHLRYLISVSENDYLDLLEKYDCPEKVGNRFGLRISTNVLKKHRSRFLEHPLLYVVRLNKDVITKHLNVDDAKKVAVQILPADCEQFWNNNFCKQYDFLLKKIPQNEKFQFVKKIFNEKYPNMEFEMSQRFLCLHYYELMTIDEKEAWALRHIETNTEIQGDGRNYLWYEYVNFGKAFPEIKKKVLITPDSYERANVIEVLVKSVRNLTDMKTLLTYYYTRHVNEKQFNKERFVRVIIDNHNVFAFDNECWTALNKLLHSMNVYKTSDGCGDTLVMYMAVMYHIIHNIDLPKALKVYILKNDMHDSWDRRTLNEKLNNEELELVYQYLVKVYINEIIELSNLKDQDNNKIEPYVQRYVRFLEAHNKTADDCPDVIIQFVNNNWNCFQHVTLFKKKEHALTQADLMRQLKQDSQLVVKNLPEVKNKIAKSEYPSFKLNSFLNKLKVYFPNDVTKEYLKNFMDTLTEKENMSSASICTVVYGIFQLADEQTKIDFMAKYVPTQAKIEHGEIDERLLEIQEGICRSMCFCRPPVPLSNVLNYITGDYLRFCLPMFQSYQAKLPQPLLEEFVINLIEAPVSVQKHALRLVFECYSIEDLKKTLYDTWNRTKSISIRYVLYKSLFKKICNEDESIQVELFEVLKKFTLELKDDDNYEVYDTYMNDASRLPEKLRGEYLTICWQTVSKFPDKTDNFSIKQIVIDKITHFIHLLDGNFVKEIVEDYVKHMLDDKNIRLDYHNRVLEYLYEAQRKLVARYIIYFSSDINFLHKNMNFVRSILNKCVEMWHEIIDDIFIFRKFCWDMIDELIATNTNKCCADAIPIFETILTVLTERLALSEIYRAFWCLKLTLLRRKAKQAIKVNYYSSKTPNLLALVRFAVLNYGMRVGKLVREFVDSKNYCISMNETIGNMIKDNINNITLVDIDDKGESYYESLKDIDVLAAEGLTDIPCAEAYLLALYVLPMDSDSENYTKILSKTKRFENVEVQTLWNNKFVYTDFKKRNLD